MNTEKFKYHFLRYNRFMVLKPNALLICVLLYYVKDFLILVIVAATAFKTRGASPELSAVMSLATPKMALSNFPALLVFYAWGHRNPQGGNIVRWIWRNGRHLILAAAIVNSVTILFETVPIGTLQGNILIGFLVFNAVAVIYVYRSQPVADVFAEFPDKPSKD